ncbi:MAG TPA: OmpH family outer membrane protein [Syntrophorhabdaceae bacterium]|nr:OmpH family outer membrane protein [Syntrophorhabdaceae bacterium]HOL06573.1 OmpH family outer membrane protein [Syntrophorhabdaceae bacterium]HPP42856.1 OmpH family outer membrane protein [Syntrophorhabdaceae bacterium]
MDNKRSRIALLHLLIILFIIITGISQVSAQTLNIGVFDLQKIIRESKTIEGYRQEIAKSIEEKTRPIKAKEESLRAMEDRFRRQIQNLSVDERRDWEEKIANEVKEIKRMREDLDIQIRKMDRDLTAKANKEIDTILKNIAERENYTIIFERNAAGIVHLKDTVDITDKILRQIK